jgi:hypothetical protein
MEFDTTTHDLGEHAFKSCEALREAIVRISPSNAPFAERRVEMAGHIIALMALAKHFYDYFEFECEGWEQLNAAADKLREGFVNKKHNAVSEDA